MLDIFDRFRVNSIDNPLIHIEDCPYLPVSPIVVKVIANNREKREYLGISRWRLIVGQTAADGSGFTAVCLQWNRVRMRSNEITGRSSRRAWTGQVIGMLNSDRSCHFDGIE
jgi:hypothetical protein